MERLIELIKYILFGAIQGVTEVLPISSSGHVTFAQEILNVKIDDSVFFLIVLNFGSMIAVIYYLRLEIKTYFCDFIKYIFKRSDDKIVKSNFLYVKNVIIGIIPLLFFGAIVVIYLDRYYHNNPLIFIALGSLMTATILFIVRNQTNQHVKTNITTRDSLFIGFLQVLALFPGLSRLGITTAAGVQRKLSMDSALKFSFMMFIPVSIATIFSQIFGSDFKFEDMMSNFDASNFWSYIYYFVGFIVSTFTTYFALKWVFILFRKGKLRFFYLYNLVFGIIVLIIAINR